MRTSKPDQQALNLFCGSVSLPSPVGGKGGGGGESCFKQKSDYISMILHHDIFVYVHSHSPVSSQSRKERERRENERRRRERGGIKGENQGGVWKERQHTEEHRMRPGTGRVGEVVGGWDVKRKRGKTTGLIQKRKNNGSGWSRHDCGSVLVSISRLGMRSSCSEYHNLSLPHNLFLCGRCQGTQRKQWIPSKSFCVSWPTKKPP